MFGPGRCAEQELAYLALGVLNKTTSASTLCLATDNFCVDNVFSPAMGDRDSDDLRQLAESPVPFPSDFNVSYLRRTDMVAAIKASPNVTYREYPNAPFQRLERMSDDAQSWLPQLGALVSSAQNAHLGRLARIED